MKKFLLSSLLLISGFSQAIDKTNQYAYGAMIDISNDTSMYSRIELTHDVYTQTLSSSLDDIRIFNQKGQPVPYALVNVYQQSDNNQTFPVAIYALNENKDEDQSKMAIEQYNININNKDVQIYLDKANSQGDYTARYLLQIPENVKLEQAISRLSIDFDVAENQNWQAIAKLLYSQDLSNWQTALNNVPMMSLTDNNSNQSLRVNTIDIPTNTNYKARYWILLLKSDQSTVPNVKKIEFTSRKETPKLALFPINFELISSDGQEATYQLPSPQPVRELSIKLQNPRMVLPTSIYYKTDDKDKTWHKLDDYIIRNLDSNDHSQHISAGLIIKQLKIKAINASFDEAPQLTAYRNRMSVVFNSANNGPFILAWGSAKAMSASLSEKALLSDSISVVDVPQAFVGENIKLAGQKVLSQANNDPTRDSILPKWLIWGSLVIGAIILIIIALKLLNEVKKS
ncbi:MAG: DUF3999 family protein [Gilliamella sp.]|nr:DUF3999 family protein [Gilliamella sp.]MCO6555143.1 DUF3999 family protein [Gilliamella sp.]